MDKLAAARARGATTTIVPKHVKLEGLEAVVEQLRAATAAQGELIAAVNKMVAVIAEKELKSTDVSQLTQAVLMLRPVEQQHHDPLPLDIDITFERDQRGLLKTAKMMTS